MKTLGCLGAMMVCLPALASPIPSPQDSAPTEVAIDPVAQPAAPFVQQDLRDWHSVQAMGVQSKVGNMLFSFGAILYPVIMVGAFSDSRSPGIIPIIVTGEILKTAGLFLTGNARNVAARAADESIGDPMKPFKFYIMGAFLSKGAGYGLAGLYGILRHVNANVSQRMLRVTLQAGIALWILGDVLTLLNAWHTVRYIRRVQTKIGRRRLQALPYSPDKHALGLQLQFVF
ncbi:MAG: hypothetical protein JXX14_26640 [Deltaproteobacteria bacterium]|nr:hypothetical protein [Deltaproteobacteria bacterium]